MKNSSLLFLFSVLLLASCKKETETITSEPLSDYLPLSSGKFITYRLDSTVFTNFGLATEVHSYQEKNEIDAMFNDNLGRPSYRVYRSIRDLAGAQPWKAAGTFFITPLDKSIEVIDNNLRSVKLSLPLKEEFSWKGNGFYPQNPYKEIFDFSIDDGIQNWSSTYTELNGSMPYKGQTISNVITVQQVDDSTNVPVTITTPYASKRRSIDRYAKGIGLVEQDFILWEYQYDISRGTYYYKGFGVKRTMIDHN